MFSCLLKKGDRHLAVRVLVDENVMGSEPVPVFQQAVSRSSNLSGRAARALAWSQWPAAPVSRHRFIRDAAIIGLAIVISFLATEHAAAQEGANAPARLELPQGLLAGPESWTSPDGLSSTIQVMLLLGVMSLAPAVLLMTTCFVRIVVVLSLLRQALGTQQLPPNQVMTSIALFLTLLVMAPVWKDVYDQAVVPYTNRQISLDQAWTAGCKPVRRFMSLQIEKTGNSDDVRLFLDYMPGADAKDYQYYEDVPLAALLPAFMLSELKTSFLIGFQIYLPFLILDMVIASVLVSMGMMMLPPVLISLPFKLMLFVLVDGWHLVVGMLMASFQAYS
jgi:flagellar biosynthetic protein FliP